MSMPPNRPAADQPLTNQNVIAAADASGHGSYVDWPAILAGAALATALSIVLLSFGSAIGLTMTDPDPGEGASMRWMVIVGGLWFIWTGVSSFAAGGYLTGRLRRPFGDAHPDEVDARDGAHGVVMWAVGAIVGAMLAVSGVTGAIGTVAGAAGSAVGNTVGAAASTAIEAVDSRTVDRLDAMSDSLIRSDGNVPDEETREAVASILANGVMDGDVPETDRAYLASLVAASTELSREDARARVDETVSGALEARAAAIEAAEQTRIAGIIAAFVLGATLIVSAGAAYFAAGAGGSHRDRNLGFRSFGR